MVVEFEQNELQSLMGLLDLACKAGGLQVAQAALPLAVKVQMALQAAQSAEPAKPQPE